MISFIIISVCIHTTFQAGICFYQAKQFGGELLCKKQTLRRQMQNVNGAVLLCESALSQVSQ